MRNIFLMAVVALYTALATDIALAIEMDDLEVTIRVIDSAREDQGDVRGDRENRSEISHKLELPAFKEASDDNKHQMREHRDRRGREYGDRGDIEKEHFDDVKGEFDEIKQDYDGVKEDYDEVKDDYNEAKEDYDEAKEDYDAAKEDYDEAREDYEDSTEDREDSRD
jgi:chromosome segregation ATPase